MRKFWKLTGRLMLVPMLLLCAWLVTTSAHAAGSQYMLEVSTGTATGTENKISFFIITYTTTSNEKHSKFLFPTEDAWTDTYDAVSKSVQTQRDNSVKSNYGYTASDLKNKKLYQTNTVDQYLFSTPQEIKKIERVQLFVNDKGNWACKGVRVFRVDGLGELYRWNTGSNDCFIDFSGALIAEGAKDMKSNLSWPNDKLVGVSMTTSGFSDDYAKHDYQDNTAKTLALRFAFADVYGAGLEALSTMSDKSGATIPKMELAETMGLTMYYTDRYGFQRVANVPGVLNAAEWTSSLLSDADKSKAIGGLAQQGESMMVGVFLPDYKELSQDKGITVTLGDSVAGTFGMSAGSSGTRGKRLTVAKTDSASLISFEVFDLANAYKELDETAKRIAAEEREKAEQDARLLVNQQTAAANKAAEAARKAAAEQAQQQAPETVRKAVDAANTATEAVRKAAAERIKTEVETREQKEAALKKAKEELPAQVEKVSKQAEKEVAEASSEGRILEGRILDGMIFRLVPENDPTHALAYAGKETSVTKSANTFLKLDSDTSSSTLWRFELSYDDYNPRYSVFHQLSGEQLVSEGDREFYLEDAGDGYYYVRPKEAWYAKDDYLVVDGESGTPKFTYQLVDSQSSQRWKLVRVSRGIDPYAEVLDGKAFRLDSRKSAGESFAVVDNSNKSDAVVKLVQQNTDPHMFWVFTYVGQETNGTYGEISRAQLRPIYRITNVGSGKALTKNGSWGFVQSDFDGRNDQLWCLELGDGFCRIMNRDDYHYSRTMNYEDYNWIDSADASADFTITDFSAFVNYTDPLAGKTFALEPKHVTGMGAAIASSSDSNGANVQLWTQDNGNARALWLFTYVGADSVNGKATPYYTITNLGSGKVFDLPGTNSAKSGQSVSQYDFEAQYNDQLWYLEDAGGGYYTISNKNNPNICLDVANAGKSDGTNIQVYTRNSTDAQKWKLVEVDYPASLAKSVRAGTDPHGLSGTTFALEPKHAAGMGVSINGNSNSNGANVLLWTQESGNKYSYWLFTYVGTDTLDGKATPFYTITNLGSGKVFDLPGTNSAQSGKSVSQYDFEAQYDDQLWYLEDTGDGYYTISNRNNSGVCLDVWGKGKSNGTDIKVSGKNGGDNQKWKLVEVDYPKLAAANVATTDTTARSTLNVSVDEEHGAVRYTDFDPANKLSLEPIYYQPVDSTSGSPLKVGTNTIGLTSYTSGKRRVPRDSATEHYLVELTTDSVSGAGTKDDIYMRITWDTLEGGVRTIDSINVREMARDFNGWWYGTKSDGSVYTEDVSYLRGVATGATLRFSVALRDVKKITSIQLWMDQKGKNDDWQMKDLSLSYMRAYDKRVIVWEKFEAEGVTGSFYYTRSTTLTPVYKYSDTSQNPVLVQQGADERIEVGPGRNGGDGSDGTVPDATIIDWSQLRYSMTFREASQELGFAKERNLYELEVKVAGDSESSMANGDCGSKNLFYFRLVFQNGNSSFVLANQQLASDSFVTGALQSIYISTNQDYGNVTAVQIIPEDLADDSDVFDKLNIESITVKRLGTGALSPTWTISSVGWIDIDYRDDGQMNSAKGMAGRNASDMIRSYTVDGSSYDVNFMLAIRTADYQSGEKQFEGNIAMTVYYDPFIPDSGQKNVGDVTKAMYSYINHPASTSNTVGGKTISDTSLMHRAGHTDRFYFTLGNVVSITRIEFYLTSAVNTQWNIADVGLYMVNGDGRLVINQAGEYERVYEAGEELTEIAHGTSGSSPAYWQRIEPWSSSNSNPTILRVNMEENEIKISPESLQWTSIVTHTPLSENDTLNVFYYPQGDAVLDTNNLPVGVITYTQTDDKEAQTSTGDTGVATVYNGQPVFYATNLSASKFSVRNSTYIQSSRSGGEASGRFRAMIRQLRSGVVINTWELEGAGYTTAGGIDFAEISSSTARRQQVLLQLGTDLPATQQVMASDEANNKVGDDIAVAIWYRSDDPTGMELRSPYVYLSDLGYTEIHPAQVLDLTFEQKGVAEITGISVVAMGDMTGSITAAYAADRTVDAATGATVETIGTYGFNASATLSGVPSRMNPVGTVQPLTLTFQTGEPTNKEGGGTNAPLRVTLGYYDRAGDLLSPVIEDIRTYLVDDEAVLTTGSTKTAKLLVGGLGQLRWVKVEPVAGTASDPASWTLSKISAKVGEDAAIDRAVNTIVREGTPLTVMFTNVSLGLTASTKGSNGQTTTVHVDGTTEDGAKRILTPSGGTVTIVPELKGSDEGWTATARRLVNGFPENAEATIRLANVVRSTSMSSLASAESIEEFMERQEEAWDTEQAIIFTAPMNGTPSNLEYLITITSKEAPDVSEVFYIGVEQAAAAATDAEPTGE